MVDCYDHDIYILLYICGGAETFAYEAHGYRPASGMPISFIGAVHQWFQGPTMVTFRARSFAFCARSFAMRARFSRSGRAFSRFAPRFSREVRVFIFFKFT